MLLLLFSSSDTTVATAIPVGGGGHPDRHKTGPREYRHGRQQKNRRTIHDIQHDMERTIQQLLRHDDAVVEDVGRPQDVQQDIEDANQYIQEAAQYQALEERADRAQQQLDALLAHWREAAAAQDEEDVLMLLAY